MTNFSALFIVFLISISAFTSVKIEPFEGISALGGIHSELIAMKTEVEKSSDGVKTIAQFTSRLMAMLKELRDTQRRHEVIAAKMFKQCKEEASFRIREITQAKQAFNAASSSFAKCQASLAAARSNLPTLRNAKKEYDDLLARRTAERAKQHAEYVVRSRDWREAIMFLNDFTNQVKGKIAKGISFADLSDNLLRHASKMGFIDAVVPLLAELAQSPAERSASVPHVKHNYTYLNQASVIRNLVHHLGNLRNRLVVDSRQNDINEAKAQKIFDAMKARLTAIINKLARDIARTRAQIHEMKICVSTEGAIMKTANNKVLRNRRLKKAARHTCADFAREFVEATRNRLAEIRTLREVLAICARRFGQLPRALVAYLEEVRNGFRRYVNSTEFHKYVAYVEKHIADNVHGKSLARFKPRHHEARILAKKNLRRLASGARRRVHVHAAHPSAHRRHHVAGKHHVKRHAGRHPRRHARHARTPAARKARRAARRARRAATRKAKRARRAAKRRARWARLTPSQKRAAVHKRRARRAARRARRAATKKRLAKMTPTQRRAAKRRIRARRAARRHARTARRRAAAGARKRRGATGARHVRTAAQKRGAKRAAARKRRATRRAARSRARARARATTRAHKAAVGVSSKKAKTGSKKHKKSLLGKKVRKTRRH